MAGLRHLGGGIIQFTDNSGNVLAAGTINTYITGTTTNKTTYSDSARTIANANPIVLDANGKAVLYLQRNGEYRFLIKNSAGSTIDTIDNIADQIRIFQGCEVNHATGQAVATSTATNLECTTEVFDTDAFHSNSVNSSRITIPIGSSIIKVSLGAQARFTANATGYRQISIIKNGGGVTYTHFSLPVSAVVNHTIQVITPAITVVDGDYFECQVFQNSGGNLTVVPSAFWLQVLE